MRNLALFISLVLLVSCNQESQQSTETEDLTIDTTSVEEVEEEIIEEADTLPTETTKKDTGYSLTDTIHIDLNGNGIIDQVYLIEDSCKRFIVEEEGVYLIEFGCGSTSHEVFFKDADWIDSWYIVPVGAESQLVVDENGDIMDGEDVLLERPSIYLGEEEAGGGIITFLNGKPYWVHQSC